MKKIGIVVFILCCGCTGPSVLIKKNIVIQKLGIYLEAGNQSTPLIQNAFDYQLGEFIETYNATPGHKFQLYRASASDSSTLTIKLVASRLVSSGQQTAGVLVSLVGLSLPFVMASAGAPLYIFFYYFPNVKSMTELSLSNDIAQAGNVRKPFLLTSSGFLRSPEKQVEKHVISFANFLNALVSRIEKQSKTPKANLVVKRN